MTVMQEVRGFYSNRIKEGIDMWFSVSKAKKKSVFFFFYLVIIEKSKRWFSFSFSDFF